MVSCVVARHLLAQSDAILQRLEQVARHTLAEYALDPLARLISSGRSVLLQPESLQVAIQGHGDAEDIFCRGMRFRVCAVDSPRTRSCFFFFPSPQKRQETDGVLSGGWRLVVRKAYVSEGSLTCGQAVQPSLAQLLVARRCFGRWRVRCTRSA